MHNSPAGRVSLVYFLWRALQPLPVPVPHRSLRYRHNEEGNRYVHGEAGEVYRGVLEEALATTATTATAAKATARFRTARTGTETASAFLDQSCRAFL